MIKLLKIAINYLNYFIDNDLAKLKKADVLFVCADENLSYVYKGKRYSPLIHSVYEDLYRYNLKVALISRSNSKYQPKEVFGTMYTFNKLQKNLSHLYKYSNAIYGDFSRNTHNSLLSRVEMWLLILRRTTPKYIIGIQPPLELCIASNLLNINIADLQHGVLSNEGYYGEKYRDCCNQLGWPTHLLCWDVDSETWAKEHIGKHVKTWVIGNPWVNRFILVDKYDDLVNKEFKKRFLKTEDKLTILVSLQYGEDNENINSIGIPYVLLNYIKNKGHKFNWLLRIHPVVLVNEGILDLNKKFNSLFQNYNNIEWEECSLSPLPLILGKVKLHITWNSAVTTEASWFGVKTAILSTAHENVFAKLNEKGFVDYVENSMPDIDLWINKNMSKSKLSHHTFTKGAYQNFLNYVNGLNS